MVQVYCTLRAAADNQPIPGHNSAFDVAAEKYALAELGEYIGHLNLIGIYLSIAYQTDAQVVALLFYYTAGFGASSYGWELQRSQLESNRIFKKSSKPTSAPHINHIQHIL